MSAFVEFGCGGSSGSGQGQTKLSCTKPFRCTPNSGRNRCTARFFGFVPQRVILTDSHLDERWLFVGEGGLQQTLQRISPVNSAAFDALAIGKSDKVEIR
jgi:hypothetical protein